MINITVASHVLDCILNGIREDWKKLVLEDQPVYDENAISSVGQLQQGEFWRQKPNSILAPITWFDEPREMYIKFAYYPTKVEEILPKRPPLPMRKKRQYAEYLKQIKSIVQTVAPVKKVETKPVLLHDDEELHSFEERLKSVSRGLPVEKTKASMEDRKKPQVVVVQEPVIKVAPAGESVDAKKREAQARPNPEDEISDSLKQQRWKVVDKKAEKKVIKKKVVSASAPKFKKMELRIKPKEAPTSGAKDPSDANPSESSKAKTVKIVEPLKGGTEKVGNAKPSSKPAGKPAIKSAKSDSTPKKSDAKPAPAKSVVKPAVKPTTPSKK